ncbi:helix-turn-helix domain-containing protein [Bradyrhizobium sp. WSM2254]|uniref:helix-turn-helix domain-containing protein n=1 Tax=Bradyrhizobium sp. WSM2254 TaxID=1188263 RepID=UPI0009FF82A3|nr:helix-turn-helix domain-containing protein [Bradyrhizobium sp. WSM2254]
MGAINLKMPSLRERGDDVLLLAQDFLTCYAKEENRSFESFSPEAEKILKQYHWPGNVRQLQHVIRHIVIMHTGKIVTPEMIYTDLLHSELESSLPQHTTDISTPPHQLAPLWQIEKEAIERTLAHCDGNVKKAAEILEVNKSTIHRQLQRWNVKTKKVMDFSSDRDDPKN